MREAESVLQKRTTPAPPFLPQAASQPLCGSASQFRHIHRRRGLTAIVYQVITVISVIPPISSYIYAQLHFLFIFRVRKVIKVIPPHYFEPQIVQRARHAGWVSAGIFDFTTRGGPYTRLQIFNDRCVHPPVPQTRCFVQPCPRSQLFIRA